MATLREIGTELRKPFNIVKWNWEFFLEIECLQSLRDTHARHEHIMQA